MTNHTMIRFLFRLMVLFTVLSLALLVVLRVGTLASTLISHPVHHSKQIAYISGYFVGAAYYPTIYLMDVDRHLTSPLIRHPLPNYKVGLSWSPDGTKLAYVMISPNDIQAVYIYDLLTHVDQRLDAPDAQSMSHPDWSPDSTRLSFSLYSREHTWWQIYAADFSQTPIHYTLLKDTLAVAPDARWSPDGTELVYMTVGNNSGTMHLEVLTLATGVTEVVTGDYGLFGPGNWSLNGEWIAFRGARPDGRVGLFVSNLTTRQERWLNSDYRYEPPVWSIDSTAVAWHGDNNGIYIQNIADDVPRLLFGKSGIDTTSPVWSPDGSQLLFTQNHRLTLIDLPAGTLHILSAEDDTDAKSIYAWRP
ncbi:MAG TPA: hypothetical protein VHL11_19580 [Phototrophicaceae bacterium]|nr:hypothetical protein [Phototrophicaceae bacterium]